MNKTGKILLGLVIISVLVWFVIHQLYAYYKKFNEQGITPLESALYAVAVVVGLSMIYGLAMRGNLFDFIMFSDLGDFITRIV